MVTLEQAYLLTLLILVSEIKYSVLSILVIITRKMFWYDKSFNQLIWHRSPINAHNKMYDIRFCIWVKRSCFGVLIELFWLIIVSFSGGQSGTEGSQNWISEVQPESHNNISIYSWALLWLWIFSIILRPPVGISLSECIFQIRSVIYYAVWEFGCITDIAYTAQHWYR